MANVVNVCCSIEMEPRTLNQGQLNHAREMAADVAQKMEPRQASAIFIQGLISSSSSGVDILEEVAEEEKDVGVEEEYTYCKQDQELAAAIIERPCQCSCNNTESPDPNHLHIQLLNNLKEPVSAPF